MNPISKCRWSRWIACGMFPWFLLAGFAILGDGNDMGLAAAQNGQGINAADKTAGLRAFDDVALVLRSPRCINCHPAGDVPRQTDRQQPHFPVVARGADGHGLTGMRCSACHQAENQPSGIPGAKHWGLAPRSMAWAGLDDHELAEQLKDPTRNGQRSLQQMLDHLSTEPLVLWAWQPGGTRNPPPLTHEQFIQRFKDWVAAGAPSPSAAGHQ